MATTGAMKAARQIVEICEGEFVDDYPDTITDYAAIIDRETGAGELVEALNAITALIGNVDHSTGNGANSAKMRGEMLNDIREVARAVLAKYKGE